MSVKYTAFAQFYDALTQNVNYKKHAAYLCALLERLGHKSGLTLDLACGTGSLTIELCKLGFDIFGIDASPDMLMQAQQKACAQAPDILFLCQNMQSIDLYGTIDTCFCTLDSINHLAGIQEVQRTFNRVSLFMNPGGYFIFDVNTVFKHQRILANHTFVYDAPGVFCVWQNTLDNDGKTVHIALDFFARRGSLYSRSSECFSERAYTREELEKALLTAGFSVESVYGELSFVPPASDSQRNIFIARKQ